jgi:hypothetical protein
MLAERDFVDEDLLFIILPSWTPIFLQQAPIWAGAQTTGGNLIAAARC